MICAQQGRAGVNGFMGDGRWGSPAAGDGDSKKPGHGRRLTKGKRREMWDGEGGLVDMGFSVTI